MLQHINMFVKFLNFKREYMNKCPYCNTTYNEILQTGFVGCAHCYEEIEPLKEAVEKMYNGKKHKGKRVKNGNI